jgi:hypothetical protein
MPTFSHRFPKVTPRHDENPDKIRASANIEDDPKRITNANSLILAKTREFCVYRGPPANST